MAAFDGVTLPFFEGDLGNGYVVAECMDSDGSVAYWLLADEPGTFGCACRECAPHEHGTRLAAALREQINPSPRCEGTTSRGSRCRSKVAAPGDFCRDHAGQSRSAAPVPAARSSAPVRRSPSDEHDTRRRPA